MSKRIARSLSLATIFGVVVLLGFNSITAEGAFPDSPMSSSTIDLNRSCPKAERYFPRSRIESIYGKKVVFTNPGNQEILNKTNSQLQEMNAKLEEMQRQAQQLGLPTQPISTSQSAYSFNGYPDSKDWEQCSVFFVNPVGGSSGGFDPSQIKKSIEEMIVSGFIEYKTPDAARKALSGSFQQPQALEGSVAKTVKDVKVSGMGDEGRYIVIASMSTNPSFGSIQIDSHMLAARKGSFVFFVNFFKESDYAKAEELLKKAVESAGDGGPSSIIVSSSPTTSTSTPTSTQSTTPTKTPRQPDNTCFTSSGLTITSYTPKETYAGDAGTEGRPLYDYYGYELYYPRQERLELVGKCLEGLTASSGDLGIDGKPAITVNWAQFSGDGLKAYVSLYVSQYAKDGDAKILLKNKYGKSSEIILKVNISGTQYLNRKFDSKKIKFYGSWPTVNEAVKKLENEANKMPEILNKPNYANLDINTKIYKSDMWREKSPQLSGIVIGNGTLLGFTRAGTNSVYIGEQYSNDINYSMSATLLHEAVHQLHFCYQGKHPTTKKTCERTSFDTEWWSKIGLSLVQCRYLPPLGPSTWVGGDRLPRCGFIRAYGAWNLPQTTLAVSLPAAYYIAKPLYEDVATMKQHWVYANGDFSKGDAVTGIYKQTYTDKLKLLEKYGF